MLQWVIQKFVGTKYDRDIKKLRPLVAAINAQEEALKKLSDAALQAKTPEFKQKLENGASLDDILVDAFAVCREGSRRVLKMRHYDVQLIGGMVLHNGKIAEMRTGEGKTLVATLPCYLNSLSGKGVHVVTVNDYLARRDCEWMGRLYNWLGQTTGVVVNQQGDEEKREAYRADITYGQNNEFGFDYLRDNMKFSALEYAQRDLNYAIVDEVDSILVDEARTPLIISGQGEAASHRYRGINDVIPKLRKDEHYVVDEKGHSVTLTDEGVDVAQELLGIDNLFDPKNLESLHILNQCLRAHALYRRDVNYMVSPDGKILIIDEFTGRVLPGRRWSDGLHQAVEAKEHVRIQEENRTMATISFQNLFRLYKKIAGMTGTAMTESEEFHKTYNLEVVPIPTNKPIIRQDYQDVVYKTEKEKFAAVMQEIEEYHGKGNPILVGTVSVEKSAAIARMLEKRGIPHEVLNAKHHEKEAYVVAQAGRKGAITVSTNMAGRGTDIILGGNPEMMAKWEYIQAGRQHEIDSEEFKARVVEIEAECEAEKKEVIGVGGLHIVGTERHESRRIDNQLRGRAGRQGDPGSSRFYLSLEDELMRIFAGDRVKTLMEKMGMPDGEPIEHPWVTKSVENAQQKVEARNFDIRKHMLEYDDVMNQQRKTVYSLRRALLDGSYEPEHLDDDGKPTGKKRPIKPSPKIREDVAGDIKQMILHFGRTEGRAEGKEAPKELGDVEAIADYGALINDVYHYFGLRLDEKELSKVAVAELHETLLDKVTNSLTQQRERALDLIEAIVGAILQETCPQNVPPEDWDWKEIKKGSFETFGLSLSDDELEHWNDVEKLAAFLYEKARDKFVAKEQEIGSALYLRIFRTVYLEEIDRAWVDHLTNMEHLRDGIGLRGYGQRDPKQEYKMEGYEIFVNMMAAVSGSVAAKVFRAEVRKDQAEQTAERLEIERLAELQRQLQGLITRHDNPDGTAEPEGPPETEDQLAAALARAQRLQAERQRAARQAIEAPPSPPPAPAVQKDEPCPCGSGEPFKECHGAFLDDNA
ncbi:MAG: preprotein translocase subunit SecA [Deltaproteobacteria bacterium]|nr:preprotein translocase subunit SecA [Deltaproteobacteria bacterium]